MNVSPVPLPWDQPVFSIGSVDSAAAVAGGGLLVNGAALQGAGFTPPSSLDSGAASEPLSGSWPTSFGHGRPSSSEKTRMCTLHKMYSVQTVCKHYSLALEPNMYIYTPSLCQDKLQPTLNICCVCISIPHTL
jgi:hypothetical protein